MPSFIALHIGAGNHSASKEAKYLKLMEKACLGASAHLKLGGSADTAVVKAIAHLEDSPLTNAGYGSALNSAQRVECDASICRTIDYKFASVGALEGVQNPVAAAHRLLLHQEQELGTEKCTKFGIVPPSFLAGQACKEWCSKKGIAVDRKLVSDGASRQYFRYKKKLDTLEDDEVPSKISRLDESDEDDPEVTDTVGAVAVDTDGNVAAGCSSGGVPLKEAGRIGPAAVFGPGLWSGTSKRGNSKVGVSCSGQGEQLIATTFARTVGEKLLANKNSLLPLKEVINRYFIDAPELASLDIQSRLMGVVAVETSLRSEQLVFHFGHTTPTFGVAWMSSSDLKPNVKISRKNVFEKNPILCELHNTL
ncbi:threonine aspartase 1-like isoform X2 [Artemia franciscana]|uniref:threonine aspartase 1-like isoform X2 n=1 Tax=Artemia franciscana TaxID=6661 RepID=UPI0032DB5508